MSSLAMSAILFRSGFSQQGIKRQDIMTSTGQSTRDGVVVREVAITAREEATAAATATGIEIREVRTADGAREIIALLDRVWEIGAGKSHLDQGLVVALAHAGNYVSVALADGEPVGAGIGFFGAPPGRNLHSHIVGVLPDAASRGIGKALKLHQKAWCLDRGITEMTWTFDPLVSRNAYFNLHQLRVEATAYYVDFYGEMKDGINSGQPSDRMLVTWRLDRTPPSRPDSQRQVDVLSVGSGETPRPARIAVADAFPDADADAGSTARVELPRDIEAIRKADPDLARQWRIALRDALTGLLDEGWRIVDFEKNGTYLLERKA
ncbi:GNAT family N-acetyltransferase [Saxibacter everestensis]|uniref:GNAT family N-acetyltransferase n=1 Tax=Saxibacter everestensis TaxID=2909229 RepID=A0ABY8QRI0_9MICO|nr:GNAT family N-acetyltransferase [Brevibacteriaceae bacterium ZFBP1038]